MSPRFVLVRGLAREAGHWQQFDRHLLARWPAATVEFHDLPGNGARWRETSPLDAANMAAQLRASVWAAGSAPPLLIAVSLGAMVCLDWRRRWVGDPLAGLVAINTSVGGLCRPWQRMRPRGVLETSRALFMRDRVARERAILALTTSTRADDPALAEAHAALHAARPIARANVVRQVIAAARFRPSPSRSAVPLLLLNAAEDRLVDPVCSRRIAEAFAAELAVHPHAGHDLTLDDPQWCVDQIAAWSM